MRLGWARHGTWVGSMGLSASGMLSGVRPEHSAWRALSRPPGPAEVSESSCARACTRSPLQRVAFSLCSGCQGRFGAGKLGSAPSARPGVLLGPRPPLPGLASAALCPGPSLRDPEGGGRGGLAGAAAGLILRALADHQRGGLGGRHVPEAGEGPCVLSHRRGGGKALGARFPPRHSPQLLGACHCPGEGLPCSHSSL